MNTTPYTFRYFEQKTGALGFNQKTKGFMVDNAGSVTAVKSSSYSLPLPAPGLPSKTFESTKQVDTVSAGLTDAIEALTTLTKENGITMVQINDGNYINWGVTGEKFLKGGRLESAPKPVRDAAEAARSINATIW